MEKDPYSCLRTVDCEFKLGRSLQMNYGTENHPVWCCLEECSLVCCEYTHPKNETRRRRIYGIGNY